MPRMNVSVKELKKVIRQKFQNRTQDARDQINNFSDNIKNTKENLSQDVEDWFYKIKSDLKKGIAASEWIVKKTNSERETLFKLAFESAIGQQILNRAEEIKKNIQEQGLKEFIESRARSEFFNLKKESYIPLIGSSLKKANVKEVENDRAILKTFEGEKESKVIEVKAKVRSPKKSKKSSKKSPEKKKITKKKSTKKISQKKAKKSQKKTTSRKKTTKK